MIRLASQDNNSCHIRAGRIFTALGDPVFTSQKYLSSTSTFRSYHRWYLSLFVGDFDFMPIMYQSHFIQRFFKKFFFLEEMYVEIAFPVQYLGGGNHF